MMMFIHDRRGAVLVAGLLLVQITLLGLSLDAITEISIFCTGPAASRLSPLFGILHLLLSGLLVLGLLSLRLVRLRGPYIGLLIAAMIALPVQATLVFHGILSCDGP